MVSSKSNSAGVKTLLGLAALAMPTTAFMPKPHGKLSKAASTWELREVIKGESVDKEPFDVGQGGVRLAETSAIKITGEVKHKPGNADARGNDLLRYKKLKEVNEGSVNDVMKKVGSTIICSGQGKEFYKDPGNTLEKFTLYGPNEAIKDAFAGAASALDSKSLVFNFIGGDDLIFGQVLEATNELVVMLDIATSAKVSFNSMSHSSIPAEACAVTVVSVGSDEGEFSGADKAIAAGEVYLFDGKYWTVDEADIDTATA